VKEKKETSSIPKKRKVCGRRRSPSNWNLELKKGNLHSFTRIWRLGGKLSTLRGNLKATSPAKQKINGGRDYSL